MQKNKKEKKEKSGLARRERRRLKKEDKRRRKEGIPLPVRISFQVVKTLLVRIPVGLLVFIILSLFFLSLYLTPPVVQEIARNTFASETTGSLDLKVRTFSLTSGFIIDDIVIRSGKDFGNKELATIKQVVFRYSLGGLLLGHVRFPEIGIYNPSFFLREKNGKWNVATLIRPGVKSTEPVEEKDEGKEKREEITLPVEVDILVNFIIKNCNLQIESDRFDAGFRGLSFLFRLDMPPFKRIPISTGAVSLLREMKIEFNPREVFEAYYRSKDVEVGPPLILTWKLDFSRTGKESAGFDNILKMGTYKTPVRFVNSHLAPLHSMISYDITYNPKGDVIYLKDFSLTFRNSKWISIGGLVTGVSNDPVFNIRMSESSIVLDELYPYYRALTGDRGTRFSGKISLMPLEIRGGLKNLSIRGSVYFKNIFYRSREMGISLPELRYGFSCLRKGDDLDVSMDAVADKLSWSITGSRPGNVGIRFTSLIQMRSSMNRIIIPRTDVKFFDPSSGNNAMDIMMKGDVFTGEAMQGWISIDRIVFNSMSLPGMVSGNLRKKVSSIPLKKPVEGNILVRFRKDVASADIESMVHMAVPDYDVPDLDLVVGIRQNVKKKRIDILRCDAGSRTRNVALSVSGYVVLEKSPFSDSDVTVSMTMNNPVMKNIFGAWEGSGLFSLTSRLKGDLETGALNGRIRMDRFTVKNRENHTAVNEMSMDFPFAFDFRAQGSRQSLLGIMQSQVIDSKTFVDRPNVRIGSVWIRHPARNIPLKVMNDFSAFIDFRHNVFRLTEMKAYVLDGSLYARRIMVNLANLDMKHLDMKSIKDNIEYALDLDLTNVDIGRLDDPDGRKKTRDAELSLNANFSGRGIDIRKELAVEGYINIFKIGEKFANRLMKGLSSEKGKSKLGGFLQSFVDNWTKVQGFQFVLSKGLAYPTVIFESRLMSMIATVDNNRIEFDRIPIQEYLRKVQKGE